MTKKVNTKNIFLSIFIQFVSYLSTLLYTVSYMLLYFLFLFFCFFISTIYFIRDDFLQKNKKNPLSLFRGQKAETEGFEPSCRDEPTNAFRVRRVTAASLRLQLYRCFYSKHLYYYTRFFPVCHLLFLFLFSIFIQKCFLPASSAPTFPSQFPGSGRYNVPS